MTVRSAVAYYDWLLQLLNPVFTAILPFLSMWNGFTVPFLHLSSIKCFQTTEVKSQHFNLMHCLILNAIVGVQSRINRKFVTVQNLWVCTFYPGLVRWAKTLTRTNIAVPTFSCANSGNTRDKKGSDVTPRSGFQDSIYTVTIVVGVVVVVIVVILLVTIGKSCFLFFMYYGFFAIKLKQILLNPISQKCNATSSSPEGR